ncbi:TRAP transporter small permease [Aliishimia ponticola]|uniref:TRAP transporter small permease protein n=1 Tax=Aliishimia ponticola TaxID=2499833 RepID=A0A4S4NAV9_9RHOB|nr:TRAP transporter small permease [Aliishimia ponticola]THH35101.1 TRAP transporter small permease [Aliishimia ponticola]
MQRLVTGLARTIALMGGLVLSAIILLTCLSIAGRTLGLGEIKGSYEILEAGVAFSIFSFFPICQLHGGHATVDVFTSGLGARALAWLRAFWEVVLAAVIVFITWRLFGGVERYYGNGETTLFLQFPVWWGYAASFVAAVIASIVALYCAGARVAAALTGRHFLPAEV